MSTKKEIQALRRRRAALVEKLVSTDAMVRGSFGQVYRRCGKATCWCADGRGHLVNRITWTQDGRSKTRAVPSEDIAWIKEMTETYRIFRKARQAIRETEAQLNQLLDKLESEIIKRTSRKHKFLCQ